MGESLRARARGLPAGTPQTRSVLSAAAEASLVLSRENFRERIAPWWPVRFFVSLPLATFQILTRPSSPPVASHFPSELAATARTSLRATDASLNFCGSFGRRQILISRWPPDANSVPSGLNASEWTIDRCAT